MCLNVLPVRGTLFWRLGQFDPQCPLCLNEVETIDHLFEGCSTSNVVWSLAIQHRWIPQQVLRDRSFNWHQTFGIWEKLDSRTMQRLSFLLWSIWKARNAVIFQNEVFNPLKCLIKAKRLSTEWSIRTCMSVDDFFQGTSSTPFKTHQFIRWQPPNPFWIKLNFDGSLQNTSTVGGFILRDWRGASLMTGASNYGASSILVAEGRTLRDGVHAAIMVGYSRLQIEGDNLIVIEALQGKAAIPWRINYIIEDVRNLLIQVDQVVIKHIYREANMAADWLSKYGHSISNAMLATDLCHPELRNIVRDDMLGRTLARRGA